MSKGVRDERAAATEAQGNAVRLLRAANRCDDAGISDHLMWHALDILEHSRPARRAWAEAQRPERKTMSRKLTAEFLGTLWLEAVMDHWLGNDQAAGHACSQAIPV